MSVLSNILGKTFFLEKRGGPSIAFSGTATDISFHSRALMSNDPNIVRGKLTFDASTDTLSAAGGAPMMSTMMAAMPGYKTAVGTFPLTVKTVGADKIEVASAPVDGDQKAPVVLTAFPPVPEVLGEHVAKATMSKPGTDGAFGQQLAWITAKDADVKSGQSANFDSRPQKEDFETGSGKKFEWRDSEKGSPFSTAIFGSASSGWSAGEADPDASTLTFHMGTHAATFQYSYETVTIPPGWGSTEMKIVKLTGDGKEIRCMHTGLSKPVIDKWTK
jgi:hypothetical protein